MAATFAKDLNPSIRVAALNALEELAAPERSRSRVAVHAVSSCIKDDVDEVRRTAERVMRTIAPGRRTAIDDIAQRLADPDEEVRQAAVKAFKGIGPANRKRALTRAVPLLRHPDAGVRRAATEAMKGMTDGEEAACIAAAASCVARFRRRFPKAAGYADWEEEEDEDALIDEVEEEDFEAPEAEDNARAAYEEGVAAALMAGDLQRASQLEKEEQERLAAVALAKKNRIKEDTDTESELSDSDTDEDEDVEREESAEGSRRDSDATSDVTSIRAMKPSRS